MPSSQPTSALNWRAPFRVQSFRFQWPADLAASWAFEMESIVLGWFILVESGSVMMLVTYGSLQYLGSLVSPLFGVVCDRIGYRRMLWCTRAVYALMAVTVMCLSWLEALTPVRVLVLAAIVGMIRPSDQMMRNALIAQSLPSNQLMGALGISRMTTESARIAGALMGAGVVALLGISAAYAVITVLYLCSSVLSTGVQNVPGSLAKKTPASPLQDLNLAFSYVWKSPVLMGAMALAFLVNMLAFPFSLGLLPYVAKNIYQTDQTGLGLLGASFALGGLLASLTLSTHRFKLRAARSMIMSACMWFAFNLWFAFNTHHGLGMALLMLTGFAQSWCMTPLAAVMLRVTDQGYRGRVMGMRMLAIWGLPIGLLACGPLVEQLGFAWTASVYSALGIALTLAMALYWRKSLWHAHAKANEAL